MENKFCLELENLNIPDVEGVEPIKLIIEALNKSGLISDNSLINGTKAKEHLQTDKTTITDKEIITNESSLITKIGSLLLHKKVINDNQLKEALDYQKTTSLMLGEILVKLGFIRKEVLIDSIEEQDNIRKILQKVHKIDISIDYKEPLFELKIKKDSENPYTFYQRYDSDNISKAIIDALSNYLHSSKYSGVRWQSEIVGLRIFVHLSE